MASTLVWCEIVGWLLPRGASRLQLHTSPEAAMIESRRNRTGSAIAPRTAASWVEPASSSGPTASGAQQGPGSTTGVTRVVSSVTAPSSY